MMKFKLSKEIKGENGDKNPTSVIANGAKHDVIYQLQSARRAEQHEKCAVHVNNNSHTNVTVRTLCT